MPAPSPITNPRINILNTDGTVNRTLYLPMPDEEGVILEWEEVSEMKKLANGGNDLYIQGWKPKLTLKYDTGYVDFGYTPYTIGTGNGQMPTLEDLEKVVFSQAPGLLQVSPNGTSPFFPCYLAQPIKLMRHAGFYAKGVTITLGYLGRVLYGSKDLGSVPAPPVPGSANPIPGIPGPIGPAGTAQPLSYTVATLPSGSTGLLAFASNGRKAGEAAGAGTGVLVCFSGGQWRKVSDDSIVLA